MQACEHSIAFTVKGPWHALESCLSNFLFYPGFRREIDPSLCRTLFYRPLVKRYLGVEMSACFAYPAQISSTCRQKAPWWNCHAGLSCLRVNSRKVNSILLSGFLGTLRCLQGKVH